VYVATLAHYDVVADLASVRDINREGTVENVIQHTLTTVLKGQAAQQSFLETFAAMPQDELDRRRLRQLEPPISALVSG
jgi:hypothetical protein